VRKSSIYLFLLGIAVVVTAALLGVGLVVSAQNYNAPQTTANTNTATKPARRHRPRPKPKATPTETATTPEATPAATPAPRRTGRCDPTQQEQTDLSGTYTGKLKHGDEPPVDATLTITGNNFTMSAGSDTHSGRLMAVTTCGYTAVTVMMGDLTPPPPGQNPPAAHPAMSLRAKKVGDSLTLTSVPGEPQRVLFTTGGGAMKPKPRRHKAKPKTTGAAATPTP